MFADSNISEIVTLLHTVGAITGTTLIPFYYREQRYVYSRKRLTLHFVDLVLNGYDHY